MCVCVCVCVCVCESDTVNVKLRHVAASNQIETRNDYSRWIVLLYSFDIYISWVIALNNAIILSKRINKLVSTAIKSVVHLS